MYVFADGYHQKWRPAQRLAVYERAIDWFDFWLNGKVDSDPSNREQYACWRVLAERQPRSSNRAFQLSAQHSASTRARTWPIRPLDGQGPSNARIDWWGAGHFVSA